MIHREILCFALAAIFTVTVVVPGVLIFWDRGLPFELVDAVNDEKLAAPGNTVHLKMTIRKVRKSCSGRVERMFVDSKGRQFPLVTSDTVYHRFVDSGDPALRTIERRWRIPDEAATGEGTYYGWAVFWCNPVQQLLPIEAPRVAARIFVISSRPGH